MLRNFYLKDPSILANFEGGVRGLHVILSDKAESIFKRITLYIYK